MKIRQHIESFFEIWSTMVVTHRWWVLLVTLAFSFAVIPQIKHGWVDISIESFMPADNPALVDYNEFRMEFNYAPPSLLTIELEDSAFTLENLSRIEALHQYIEQNTPYLMEVTSLYNVRYTRGEEDEMITGELNELWPETEEEIPAFREIVLSNANYTGAVISEDEHILVVVIEPLAFDPKNPEPNEYGFTYLRAEEEGAFSETVHNMAASQSSPGFTIRNAGGTTMNHGISKDMERSTGRSMGLGMLIIIVLLGLLFRRVSGVVLPLLVVALSLMMTLAIWPVLGFPYNGNTQIIPTFLLAVGIADAIHILSIFYKHYDNGMAKDDAITLAVKETAIAVLLTTITTAVGLMSFLASDMMPTFTMGMFGAIGVVLALFYTLALIPSLLSILPIKRHFVEPVSGEEEGEEKPSFVLRWVDATIEKFADIGLNHAKKVVGFTAIVSVLALVGVSKMQFEHNPLAWYPEGHVLRDGIDQVDSRMDGTMQAYILLDLKEKNALHEPQVLNAIEDIEQTVINMDYADVDAREATSILSVIKETNQALNANDPSFFSIPQDKQMVAQELLLFESGSDDMYDFANYDLSLARIDIRLKWSNVLHYRDYVGLLKQTVEDKLKEHGLGHVEVKIVGLLPIFGETLFNLLFDTIKSYGLAFIFVFIIMALLMESLRGGLIAFAPNIFPILLTVGVISFIDVPLNIITSTIGCIIIGISVDDTIHFMHHFQRFMKQTNDIKLAIHKTLHTCGRAIFFTSVVLVGGFIVHLTGELSTNKEFGWILSIAIFIALIANLILAPALMSLFYKQPNKA
jgi:predicted RND superfamily exporter protein